MGDNSMSDTTSRGLSVNTGKLSPELANHIPSIHTDSRESTASPEPSHDSESKPTAPVQKRRRVTRACDECRRKKIKCDGKQPCTHCTVYSYECTYDQPSNRRRNPAPQYIEALEQRLHKAEAIIRAVLPGLDLEDPKFDAHSVDQLIEASKATNGSTSRAEDDAQMQSMVDQAGSLDLDDTGHWDFHGQSSGFAFMRRFRAKFGDSLIPIPHSPDPKGFANLIESPKSMQSSPFDANGVLLTDLPAREVAINYCKCALEDGCALSRPLHTPTFYKRLNSIYDTDPEHWNTEQMRFLPLLYIVMALGCLFTPDFLEEESDGKGYREGIEQGYQFFNASKSMLDTTDCRDLLSIQTVTFMILFLQGSAKLATCYSYIGIAMRACLRLGMHRKVNANFNSVEREERKRIFWLVRKLDCYCSTMLGLPQMLSEEDVDQELPAEIHDDYIREDGILAMPPGTLPLMKATNAHTKLMMIMKKVLNYVYPLKMTNSPAQPGQTYTVGHSRIRELERDLQVWMDKLPMELRPSENSDLELSRVQQLLRMSYAYVQMMMYRPFLHYVSPTCQTGRTDKRSFACAAACVSVARNVVHITSEMRRRHLLGGSYWFVMYITYFAILALVYFILENPDSATSKDILKDAREGRETLAALAKKSLAADRCSVSLNELFEQLPEKINERRTSLQSTPSLSRKRPQPITDPAVFPGNLAVPRSVPSVLRESNVAPHRTRSIPSDHHNNRNMKKNSLPASSATSISSYGVNQPVGNGNYATPDGTPSASTFDWSVPQIQQGNFPDLKNVMFPSDNPFAYGNQPISTLEDNPFGGLQDMAMDQYSSASSNQYPSPDLSQTAPQPRFSMNSFTGFGSTDSLNHQPSNNFGTPDMTNSFNVSGSVVSEPDSMHPNPPNQETDDYWSHAPGKGQFRTGFTPGAPSVNLDELFGGGNGWGPANLGMDINMGMGTMPNQENMGAAWSGPNGTANWQ